MISVDKQKVRRNLYWIWTLLFIIGIQFFRIGIYKKKFSRSIKCTNIWTFSWGCYVVLGTYSGNIRLQKIEIFTFSRHLSLVFIYECSTTRWCFLRDNVQRIGVWCLDGRCQINQYFFSYRLLLLVFSFFLSLLSLNCYLSDFYWLLFLYFAQRCQKPRGELRQTSFSLD